MVSDGERTNPAFSNTRSERAFCGLTRALSTWQPKRRTFLQPIEIAIVPQPWPRNTGSRAMWISAARSVCGIFVQT